MKLTLFLTICGMLAVSPSQALGLGKKLELLQSLPGLITSKLAPAPAPTPAPAPAPAPTQIRYIHHLKEVPVPVVKHVPIYRDVVKYLDRPVVVEKRVPVNVTVYKDRIVEKPVEKIVYKDKIVHKTVEVPVVHVKYVDRPVQVTKYVPYEKIVEKTVHIPVERKVETVKEVEVVKEKIVEKPTEVIKKVPFETIVHVQHDKFVHVHEPHPHPHFYPQPAHDFHPGFGHHLHKRSARADLGPRVGLLKKMKNILYTNPLLTTALIGGTGAVLGGVATKHYNDQFGLADTVLDRAQHHHHNNYNNHHHRHRHNYDDYDYDYERDCK